MYTIAQFPRLSAGMSALVAAVALLSPAPAAEAAEVKLELSVTVKVGKHKLEGDARRFVADLERDLATAARSGRGGRELATLAEERVRTFERQPAHRGALRADGSQPAKAEVSVSLSITIKTGGKKPSRQDRAFLDRLERDLAQQVRRGRLDPDDVPQAVEEAMDDYAQTGGGTASWGERPNTTVMLKITIKF